MKPVNTQAERRKELLTMMMDMKLNQVSLARIMGVDKSTVNHWLSGKREITDRTISHIRSLKK